MTDTPKQHETDWRKRRRFMYIVCIFCAAVITYVLHQQLDTKPAETAVMFSFLTIFGCVGAYVFGAAWEDTTKIKR